MLLEIWFNEELQDELKVEKMNIKFEEGNEEPNPLWVLQQISEEAFRVAGEALRDVYAGNSSFPPLGPGHRRTRSEVVTTGPRRNSSFHRMKTQMQKAWRWGSNSTDESCRSSFNPEVLANQKRQWYQLHSKALVFYLLFICLFFFFSFVVLRLY